MAFTNDDDDWDMLPEFDILAKVPADFDQQLVSKKWSERKEPIDTLNDLMQKHKRLDPRGPYGTFVSQMKAIVAKDSNILVAAAAARCIGLLAEGLREKFAPYAADVFGDLLEKFKDKKPVIVDAVKFAIDAVARTTKMDPLCEDLCKALGHKSPSVRIQTAQFLARYLTPSIAKGQPMPMAKPVVKQITPSLLACLGDADGEVRNASALSLSCIRRLLGDKMFSSLIGPDASSDKQKMSKIDEAEQKINADVEQYKTEQATRAAAPTAAAPTKANAPVAESEAPPAALAAAPEMAATQQPSAPVAQQPVAVIEEDDDWDMLPEFNILAKVPGDFEEQLASKKWSERKAPIDALNELMQKHKRLEPKGSYNELVSQMKAIITRDSNILVAASAARCIGLIAMGIREKFAPLAPSVFGELLEKFKDKKAAIVDAVKFAVDAVAKTTKMEPLSDDMCNALSNKSPAVRIQAAQFLTRYLLAAIARNEPMPMGKPVVKQITVPLLTCLGDADGEVRNSSATTLACIRRLIGEKPFGSLVGADVSSDKQKMSKIDEGEQKMNAELEQLRSVQLTRVVTRTAPVATTATAPVAKSAPVSNVESTQTNVAAPQAAAVVEEDDGWDLLPEFDIIAKIPADFDQQLASKKWSERKEPIDTLNDLMQKHRRLDPRGSYAELVSQMKTIITKDANILVAASAARCLSLLAEGLRDKFGSLAADVFGDLLEKFKDKKAVITDPVKNAVDAIAKTTKIDPLCEDLCKALSHKSPAVRIQTAHFLARYLTSSISKGRPMPMAKPVVKQLTPPLLTCLGDADADVRNAAAAALACIRRLLGDKLFTSLIGPDVSSDKQKMGKIDEAFDTLNKEVPPVAMVASVESAPAPAVPTSAPTVAATPRRPAATKAPPPKQATPPRDETPAEEGSGLIIANGQKEQRFKEEKALKILKWNFTTSATPEHIEQLKAQLSAATKPELFSLLFHTGFKMHLKAIDLLVREIETNTAATLGASDLLLKWCTLRFLDTNPSVLIKCLEFCFALTNEMQVQQVDLHDYEVQAFVPLLLVKMGDPKSMVVDLCRSILHTITVLYPASKVWPHLCEATKTKNARQKAEALEQMAQLIETNTTSVCGNLPAAVKLITAAIGDRDSNTRNAALNAMTMIHMHVDDIDKFNKLIAHMNAKERALLDERIKRAARSRPRIVVPQTPQQPVLRGGGGGTGGQRRGRSPGSVPVNGHGDGDLVNGIDHNHNTPQRRRGKYQLDENLLPPMELEPEVPPQLHDLTEVYKMMEEKIEFPKLKTRGMLTERERVQQRMSASARSDADDAMSTASGALGGGMRRAGSFSSVASTNADPAIVALDTVIGQVHSNTLQTSVQAIVQLNELLCDGTKVHLLTGKIDQVLMAIYFQMGFISTEHMADDTVSEADITRAFQSIIALLLTINGHEWLVREASEPSLKGVLSQLLSALIDQRITRLAQGAQLIKALNMIAVKLIDSGEPTAVMVALMKLLRETLQSPTANNKFTELVMKCLWKQCRRIESLANELRIGAVLHEAHVFMQTFPMASWKQRESDTPLRTIKTILNTMCKAVGDSILDYCVLIDSPEKSEAVAYVRKTLRDLESKQQLPGQVPNPTEPQSTVDTDVKLQVSQALRKIADREKSREGLTELYQLVTNNPSLDLNAYLTKSTPFFRKYVEDKMSELRTHGGTFADAQPDQQPSAAARHAAALAALDAKATHMPRTTPGQSPRTQLGDESVVFTIPEVIEMYNNLQELRKKAGLPLGQCRVIQPSEQQAIADSHFGDIDKEPPKPVSKPQNIDQEPRPARPRRSQADLDALRRRLESIKRQSNAY